MRLKKGDPVYVSTGRKPSAKRSPHVYTYLCRWKGFYVCEHFGSVTMWEYAVKAEDRVKEVKGE